jgi:hypothetical protein
MTRRNILFWLGAAMAAGCGADASLPGVGDTPYHVELALLDPATADELTPAAGDDAVIWPIGMPEGPVIAVTYWADRTTPPLSLVVRAVGAGLVGGTPVTTAGADADVDPCAADPWANGCPCVLDQADPDCVCTWDPCYYQCVGFWYPEDYGCSAKAGGTAETSEASIPLEIIDGERRTVRIGVLPPALRGRALITVVLGGASQSVPIDFSSSAATISAPPTGVADGTTETPVTITGIAGQVVTVVTSRGTFVAPGFSSRASVLLVADEPGASEGGAIIGLVSSTGGPAVVSIDGSLSDWVRVDFEDVLVSFGNPVAIDFLPGKVVHEICAATNSAVGTITLANTAENALLVEAGPQPVLVAGDAALPASCPSGSFAGYALFRWAASGTTDTLTATWTGPGYGDPITASRRVTGETFAGYGGTLDATPLDFDDPYPLLLEAHLTYLAVGGLDEQPAADVGVTFLVLSDWDAVELTADVSTGPDGTATAVYQVAADDTLQVFLQPEGWSTILLGSAP